MGFKFGFTEDIDENSDIDIQNESINQIFINPIDQISDNNVPPKFHTLEELLQNGCVNSRITFEPVELSNRIILYRRELFDVRHQLMLEDGSLNKTNGEEFNILIGETGEDLKNGVYEGGLKSWECSFDVIDKLSELKIIENAMTADDNINIIELGCGTSLPSIYILKLIFQQRMKNLNKNNNSKQIVKFILSDFNYDVLRLVTLPNILINWCFTVLSEQEFIELQKRENIDGNIRDGEIDLTNDLLAKFSDWLRNNDIEINFISGSWCRNFMEIINNKFPEMENQYNIVLTSETIYSPAILPVISEMMVELTYYKGVSILSAKDIYFGVGGSIVECLQYLQTRPVDVKITHVPGNLKRSFLEIKKKLL
jgi:protein-histidine N-methyltransferase